MERKGEKILVGISSCLLGHEVRYDGRHKKAPAIVNTLAKVFELTPLCPEVAIGLAVPREPIKLVKRGSDVRSIGVETPGLDVTDKLRQLADSNVEQQQRFSGYVFKANSPSCGVQGVNVYSGSEAYETGAGIYVRQFSLRHPLIPIVDESHLGNPLIKESFIHRVFVLHQWQQLMAVGLSVSELNQFNAWLKAYFVKHTPARFDPVKLKCLDPLLKALYVTGSDEQVSEVANRLATHYIAEVMNTL